MVFANKSLRLQIYLFILAVLLNLVWEVAQIMAYDFPATSLSKDLIGCLVPSLGDGLMTLIIFWTGWAVFRDSHWILNPTAKAYVLMLVVGVFLAITLELNALNRTRAWAYNESMPIIPVVGVGVLPVLQMVILPPVTARLVRHIMLRRYQNRPE